jgi:ferredoxin
MKFAVDLQTCDNHGQCTYAAPDVFSLNDDGELAFRDVASDSYVSDDIDEALWPSVEEAIDMCPARALRVSTD